MDKKLFVHVEDAGKQFLINLANVTFVSCSFEGKRPSEVSVHFGPKDSVPFTFKGAAAERLAQALGLWKRHNSAKKKRPRTYYPEG
jgi:hypothetical protein